MGQRQVGARHVLLIAHQVVGALVIAVGGPFVMPPGEPGKGHVHVVGRAAHEAIGHARPDRDGLARGHKFCRRVAYGEEFMGADAVAIDARQRIAGRGIVQRVIEARDRARGVARGRMRGDILDALAIDIDRPAVAQAFQIFASVHQRVGRGVFVLVHGPSSLVDVARCQSSRRRFAIVAGAKRHR